MMILRESDSGESMKQGMDLLEKASELGLKEVSFYNYVADFYCKPILMYLHGVNASYVSCTCLPLHHTCITWTPDVM